MTQGVENRGEFVSSNVVLVVRAASKDLKENMAWSPFSDPSLRGFASKIHRIETESTFLFI